jgi:hypothetical protein
MGKLWIVVVWKPARALRIDHCEWQVPLHAKWRAVCVAIEVVTTGLDLLVNAGKFASLTNGVLAKPTVGKRWTVLGSVTLVWQALGLPKASNLHQVAVGSIRIAAPTRIVPC